jgi:hypothetical protein
MMLKVDALQSELEKIAGVDHAEHGTGPPPYPGDRICAILTREERFRNELKVFYTVLVAILALLTVILLVRAGFLIAKGDSRANGVTLGASGLVTCGGAAFLGKLLKGANREWAAAFKALRQSGCMKTSG